MGRRKIKMEKVKDTNTKQVTFSKRRLGLFKKASELATLCNVEVGIVVFSPGNKPYSFGKPSFDSIADRFNSESEDSDNEETSGYSRGRRVRQEKKVCESLNSIIEEVEAEKKRGEYFQNCLESGGEKRFEKRLETLTLEELKEYEVTMENVHERIQSNINRMQASSVLVIMSKDNNILSK